jgi:hypothetical protein
MAKLMAMGADPTHALQLQGGWGKSRYQVEQTTMAAFLIARGPSAMIVLPPYDRPMLKSPFGIEGVNANADPGTPLGPGKASGTTFTRSYTKADVTLDCAAFTSTIQFK